MGRSATGPTVLQAVGTPRPAEYGMQFPPIWGRARRAFGNYHIAELRTIDFWERKKGEGEREGNKWIAENRKK